MRPFVAALLRHRGIVLTLPAALVVAGIIAFRDLPIEAYPDVTNIQAQVITLWPGHAAEEVERFITIPVENQLNGIAKRAALRSISLFGLSVVTIVFDDDADGFRARSLVAPPGFSPEELKAIEDWTIERRLRTVSGVVDVVGFGGPTKQYQVIVSPERLQAYHVSLSDVLAALAAGNRNAGGTYIEHGPQMYVVRGLGLV